MLKGMLGATSDIGVVDQSLLHGCKVIYLGDPISIDPFYRDKFIVSSILVPDYQAMAMQVDGNESGFLQMYTAALTSRAAMEMFALILVCLYKGTNILFYLPPEAAGLNYITYLLQFIDFNFGVTTQTKTSQFYFNPAFTSKVIQLLYLNNLITPQEFLVNSDTLDDTVLKKLVVELHPMVEDPTSLECIIKWFGNYKKELLETGKPLVNGIQYADKVENYACY